MRDDAFGGGCQTGQAKNNFMSMPLRNGWLILVGRSRSPKKVSAPWEEVLMLSEAE